MILFIAAVYVTLGNYALSRLSRPMQLSGVLAMFLAVALGAAGAKMLVTDSVAGVGVLLLGVGAGLEAWALVASARASAFTQAGFLSVGAGLVLLGAALANDGIRLLCATFIGVGIAQDYIAAVGFRPAIDRS